MGIPSRPLMFMTSITAPTGGIRWQKQISGVCGGSPQVTAGVVLQQVVGELVTDNQLHVLDAQTGAERTTYAMVGQTIDLSRMGTLLTSQTTAYAVTSTPTAVAWSVASGAVLWERPLAGTRGSMVATDSTVLAARERALDPRSKVPKAQGDL